MTLKTPYDTTAGSGYQNAMKHVALQVKQALVTGDLKQAATPKGFPLKGIYTIPSYFKGIDPFYHPVVVEFRGEEVIVVDSRAYLRSTPSGEQVISNRMEYEFLIMRAALMKAWLAGGQMTMLGMADLPLQTFCGWVPMAIVRNKHLDPHHQQTLTALAGLWFLSQFTELDLSDEAIVLRAAGRVARLTRVPADFVLRTAQGLTSLVTMEDFCAAARERVDSPRMSDFSPGLLVAFTKSAWFGAAAQEVSAMALEYPPYLMAMVASSVDDRSYKNSRMTQLVEIYDRQGLGRQYALAIAHLIQEK